MFWETVQDRAIDAIDEYLDNTGEEVIRRPLLVSPEQPVDVALPADYTFEYEIALQPKLSLSFPDKSTTLTHYEVVVTDEYVEDEVEDALMMAAKLQETEQVENEEDILYLTGKPEKYADWTFEDIKAEWDFPIIVEFPKRLREQAIGKRAGDILYLNPDKDLDGTERLREYYLEGIIEVEAGEDTNRDFELHVLKVARNVKPPLNEKVFEFHFPGKNITTTAAFKEALRHKLIVRFLRTSDDHLREALLEELVKRHDVPLATDVVRRLLVEEEMFEYNTDREKARVKVESRYPNLKKSLTQTLVIKQMAEKLEMKVSPKELRAELEEHVREVMRALRQPEDAAKIEELVNKSVKNEDLVENSTLEALQRKVLNYVETLITVEDVKIAPHAFFALHAPTFK